MSARRSLLDVLLFRVLVPATVLVLIGLGSELVAIRNQGPIQREIDAHAVRVQGTYAGLHEAESKWDDDLYVVDYEYEGRPIRVELRVLPDRPSAGDGVCMEIDAHHPDHARPCGTRGDLDDAKNGLVIGSSALGALLLFYLAVWIARLRRKPSDEEPTYRHRMVPTAKKLRGRPVTLYPAVVTRIGMTVVWSSASVVAFLATWTDAGVPRLVPALIVVGTPAFVVRWLRAAVKCADGVIAVRGIFVTRRIPVTSVIDVRGEPPNGSGNAHTVIHWRARSGATSRTRLFWFATAKTYFETVDRHNEMQLATLRRWIEANRVGEGVVRVSSTG